MNIFKLDNFLKFCTLSQDTKYKNFIVTNYFIEKYYEDSTRFYFKGNIGTK